jgi:Zn-finger nucleic acid-binding protein
LSAQPDLHRIFDYRIKRGPLGVNVKYDCPGCTVRLTSGLFEAGSSDSCPDCGTQFVVPGEKEKLEDAQQLLDSSKERAAEAAQREAEAARRKAELQQNLTRKLAEEARRAERLQLDRDPLREWYVYVILMGVLMLAAAGNHLVRAITTDDSGLCLLIIGLFAFGFVLNLQAVKSLRSEFVCAAFLVKKMLSSGGFSEVIQSKPAGVFHQHIHDLVKIARHDPNVSQDSLITLLYSRMMARSRIIDVLAGVLVSLGLIGTIVGLISMTDGLTGTLDSLGASGDASALMTGMRGTMQGLGTAFYTTLVGAILGSVVLRILNNVYVSNVDHFVSYIASLTEVRITPRLRKIAREERAVEMTASEIIE